MTITDFSLARYQLSQPRAPVDGRSVRRFLLVLGLSALVKHVFFR